MDNDFWIIDAYYFELNNKRYYVCHDNSYVYDKNNRKIQVWKINTKKDPHYILPIAKCPKIVRDSFLIASISIIMNSEAVCKRNGKEVKLKKNRWLDLAGLINYKKLSVIKINGVSRLLKGIDHTLGKNKIIFSIDLLLKSKFYESKKHEVEIIVSKNKKKIVKREYKNFITDLVDKFPRRKYVKTDAKDSSNIHFGQLKLLLSEIEFLTDVCNTQIGKPILVLYPGGGPGDHIPLLSQMFPMCYFILIDPLFETQPKQIKIVPDEKIYIRGEYFSNDFIKNFRETQNTIMISDIRSTPNISETAKNYEFEFEKHVLIDMKLQKDWYGRLQTDSLLKFRLPYTPGQTTYACGTLKLQAFAPYQSTEMRLIPDTEECVYDHTKIEEQLFYFNTKYRNAEFYDLHPLFGLSYDTLREYYILKNFLEYRKIQPTEENIYNLFRLIDNFFNRIFITDILLSK